MEFKCKNGELQMMVSGFSMNVFDRQNREYLPKYE